MAQKSDEHNLITAFMDQMHGIRADIKSNNDSINTKFDEQSREIRRELREVRDDIAAVGERLAKGSERMENMRRDIDNRMCACQSQSALERKQMNATTEVGRKSRQVPWWAIVLLTGALTYVGEKGIRSLINALADPPAIVHAKP